MEKETKIKLTKAQKKTLSEITSYPGGHLRMHRKNGKVLCYRLMDSELNPIKNLSYSMVNKLINRHVVKKQNDIYVAV